MSNPGISLSAAPDYSLQQAQILQQQQLAQALAQTGNEPLQAQSAGGITAPISSLSLLAKALNSFGGAYLSGKARQDEAGLSKQERQDAAKMLSGFYRAPDSQGLTPNVSDQPTQMSFSAPPVGGGPGMTANATVQSPTVGTPQMGNIPGAPTSYPQQQQMLNQFAMSDNPYLQKIAPELAAQVKPQFIQQSLGSTLNQFNPSTGQLTNMGSSPLLPNESQRNAAALYGPGYATDPRYIEQLRRESLGIKSPEAQAQAVAQARAMGEVKYDEQNRLPPAGANGMAVGAVGDPIPHPEAPGYYTHTILGTGGLTQARIDDAALQLATTGKLPAGLGMGSTGVAGQQKMAIQNRSAEMNQGGNLAAHAADLHSLTSALNDNVKQGTQISTALSNATSEGNQVLQAFNGKINTSIPLVNAFTNAAQYNLDPKTVSAYKAGLADLAATYSQVFGRGGQVTDQVRAAAKDIADGNISIDALKNVLNQVNAQGEIIVKGYQDKRGELQNQLGGIVRGQGGQGGAPQPGNNIAPAGTKATGPGGKTLTSDGKGGWN